MSLILLHQTPKVENNHDLQIMCSNHFLPGSHTLFFNDPLSLVAVLQVSIIYATFPHWLCSHIPLLYFSCCYYFAFLLLSSSETPSSSTFLFFQSPCLDYLLTGTHSSICCFTMSIYLQTIVGYLHFGFVGFLLPPVYPYPLVASKLLSHLKTTSVQYLIKTPYLDASSKLFSNSLST